MDGRMVARRLLSRGARVAGALALAVSSGCAMFDGSAGETRAGPTISAVRHPILEDIPKPAGFVLVDDRSVARESGKHRIAKVEFLGGADRDSVYRFYQEYMPSAGFTLVRRDFVRGEYSMRYQSATEECIIRIRPERGRTAVMVDIGPKPEGTADRARPLTRQP